MITERLSFLRWLYYASILGLVIKCTYFPGASCEDCNIEDCEHSEILDPSPTTLEYMHAALLLGIMSFMLSFDISSHVSLGWEEQATSELFSWVLRLGWKSFCLSTTILVLTMQWKMAGDRSLVLPDSPNDLSALEKGGN
jgi:hypothetical protein